ncbi:MAG: hypothetical protein ACLFVE_14095 [Chitinispirillaceae bacterium]
MNSPLRHLENQWLYNMFMKTRPFSGRTLLLVVCIAAFLFYVVFIRAFIGSLRIRLNRSVLCTPN